MHRNGKNIRRNKDWIQGFNYNERISKTFTCFERISSKQWWSLTRFQIIPYCSDKNQLRRAFRWKKDWMDWELERLQRLQWYLFRNLRTSKEIYVRNGRKKKGIIQYEFDKIANNGKFTWNLEVIEALFIDKYHRTHKEFMETPYEVIEIILMKWESDSKAEKNRAKSLQTLQIKKK